MKLARWVSFKALATRNANGYPVNTLAVNTQMQHYILKALQGYQCVALEHSLHPGFLQWTDKGQQEQHLSDKTVFAAFLKHLGIFSVNIINNTRSLSNLLIIASMAKQNFYIITYFTYQIYVLPNLQ